MPFCYSPWTNIDISPQGTLSPCCKFQLKHYRETYNVQTHDLDEYLSSEFLAQVKEDFNNDQWPQGCERCQIEEQNNIESKRQLDYQRWQSHYKIHQTEKILTASVAFGNTCNLKCITCNSYSSSKWYQEYQSVYNIEHRPVHFYRKNFIDQFVSQVPDLVHLDIPGGEPLLSGTEEQKRLLDFYIESGQAKDITLHYTTNANVYPDQSWWDRWQHFQEIDLQLSIDGIGDRYEYIRYPASWDILQINVGKYLSVTEPNVRLSVSHTVSAYNIFYIDEFVQWCYNRGLPKPWLGRVHNPVHMRPTVWLRPAKDKIANRLNQSQIDDVKNWAALILNEDDSQHWEDFKKYLVLHDQHRNTDFGSVFPELAEYIK